MPLPKLQLMPRFHLRHSRHFDGDAYTDVDVHFLHLLITVRLDDRGVSLHVDEKFTPRFLEFFVDRPTGEVCLRLSYKKEYVKWPATSCSRRG